MTKFRLYFDKDVETEWLNEMAAQGWAMKRFFAGFYQFEKCEKGEYIYQVDFGNRLFSVTEDYREFMEDAGVEIVQTWGFWVILRKPASEGKFELYSDIDSSIEHYTKIRKMFKTVLLLEIFVLFFEMYGATVGSPVLWTFVFVIGAIVLVIGNALMNTNKIIGELKQRRGDLVSAKCSRQISMFLAAGLLLNACALIMDGHTSRDIRLGVQILAIIFMLWGVYSTCRNKKD